jgi:hypothetical protein
VHNPIAACVEQGLQRVYNSPRLSTWTSREWIEGAGRRLEKAVEIVDICRRYGVYKPRAAAQEIVEIEMDNV